MTMPAYRQRGFVLVAVLWVLAGLAVLAAYISSVSERNVSQALAQKQLLSRELQRLSTEATLIYLLATRDANHRSLLLRPEQLFSQGGDMPPAGTDVPRLDLDGTVYQGLGEVRFALQDESGLVSVNSPAIPVFTAWLDAAGVDGIQAQRLKIRLADYIDVDQELSLDGAEYFDYRQQGREPPADGLMATPLEMTRVLGFSDLVSAEQWRKLKPFLTSRQAVGYNFNVMVPEVMGALLEIDDAAVEKLVAARREVVLNNLQQIEAIAGRFAEVDEDEIRITPSRFIRVATWVEGSRQRFLTGVELTPFVAVSPWRKDYYYTETADEGDLGQPQKVASALLQ